MNHLARRRNWISFRGTAAQVEKALHTSIHRFSSGAETRYSNISQPSVPEALADVVDGFIGLNNFPLTSQAIPVYDSISGSHYMP